MSFYKTTGASLKEVQDEDLLYASPNAAAESIKPKIYEEDRNQIFFIRSSRLLGDKYRGRNTYFTIKPECDCHNCLFSANGISCALNLKILKKYTEYYPWYFCIIENVHFEEYKI